MAVAPLNMSTPGYVSTGITFRQFVAAHVAAALAPAYASGGTFFEDHIAKGAVLIADALIAALTERTAGVPNQPKCEHGATEDETCPECLGAPSDDPNDLLTDDEVNRG
jgi:hypothetical protein